MTTQPERDALEAAAKAGREAIRPYQRLAPGPDAALSALEWGEMQEVYQRTFRMIAQAAITAYLTTLSERGMRVMPREATPEMVDAYVSALPPRRTYEQAAKIGWAAMFDAFDPNHNKNPESDGGKG